MGAPVTRERRRYLRDLADGSTPGPWRTTMNSYAIRAPREHDDAILASAPRGTYADEADASRWLANSELMAESKVAVPEMLDEIETLLAALAELGPRKHGVAADGRRCLWFSAQLLPEARRECDCGAAEHNAKVNAILEARR